MFVKPYLGCFLFRVPVGSGRFPGGSSAPSHSTFRLLLQSPGDPPRKYLGEVLHNRLRTLVEESDVAVRLTPFPVHDVAYRPQNERPRTIS